MTRHEVLGQAVDQCMKELYSLAQPTVNWEEFIKENKEYIKKEEAWHQYNELVRKQDTKVLTEKELKTFSSFPSEWKNKSCTECIGPRPYEFYYLPREIMKEICDSYVYAYNIDSQRQLLDIIEILKNYCKDPIIDKYIEECTDEDGNWHPGHRGYEHPKNLKEQITELLGDVAEDNDYYPNRICEKFFEFLDMAGKFYNWNRDLNSFNMSVYLGASPNSNKDAVIENWKKYRDKDIKIDEEQIKKEYYGEED